MNFRNICILLPILWMLRPATVLHAENETLQRSNWKLLYEESFDQLFDSDAIPWTRDLYGPKSPWHVGPLDDDGEFFQCSGGDAFRKQLATFHTYRKRIPFGKNNWLTLELAARDSDKNGEPEHSTSFKTRTLQNGDTVGHMVVGAHDGGLLLRSTKSLPPRYRIEYELVTFDFGGSRYGSWTYDGRFNGYNTNDAIKTNHPWAWTGGDQIPRPYHEWFEVTHYNGFYYLGIMDYMNAAPYNNVFIHTHRKVVIDSYTVYGKHRGEANDICNPVTKEYYRDMDNNLNMIFFRPGFTTSSYHMQETPCGVVYDEDSNLSQVVSAGQLLPELMPTKRYNFAIERDETGYTLEARGHFRYIGEYTHRYHRDFIQDGRPIWHYNQTPDEYDGSFNKVSDFGGPFGKYVVTNNWPSNSGYPDFFIIGDPHMNFYEGSASIDNVRLYVRP